MRQLKECVLGRLTLTESFQHVLTGDGEEPVVQPQERSGAILKRRRVRGVGRVSKNDRCGESHGILSHLVDERIVERDVCHEGLRGRGSLSIPQAR